jgi:3-methyladenine DNA glycosylase AlkD
MSETVPIAAWIEQLQRELQATGTPVRAVQEQRYLKSDLAFLGAGMPAIRSIVRSFARAQPTLDRATLLALVEALWLQPVHELRMTAVELLDYRSRLLEEEDIAVIERLLRGAKTWAFVDNLAESVAGALVVRYPALNATLDRWSGDADFWLRRSSMLALLLPLRAGGGDFERFAGYADRMLDEREFFIRKAIGWVLREVSKKRPQLVYDWLAPRVSRASGVTLREAVKYLSAEQRERLLARLP